MNEEQYQVLCRATDQILQASDSTPARIAIPWLHIIREHPVFLKNYEGLFVSKISFRALIKKWFRPFRYQVSLLKIIFKSMYNLNSSAFSKSKKTLSNVDIMFISHLLNESQTGDREDFYYSDLPQKLINDNHPAMIAMLNHTGNSVFKFSGEPIDGELPRVVFPLILVLKKEIKNILFLWKECDRLKKLSKVEPDFFKKKIICRASQEALSPASLNVMRLATQIKSLVYAVKPKIMILTHEGHAWERLAFSYARQANPSIVCIGYMQAPLFQRQHAVKQCLAKEYNPDEIFTSGRIQKKQLEKEDSLKNIPIKILGSNRCLNETAISRTIIKNNLKYTSSQQTCLVIPEGIISEAELMFKFSLECARKNPDVRFIWRLHPILSFASIVSRNSILRTLPDNIRVSDKGLEDDLKRSEWALYRGSSAIIQAVVAGLRPLYLHLPNQLSIDPLFELDIWKIQIETKEDFLNVLSNYTYDKIEYQKTREYCLDYFIPFDYNTMVKLFRDKIYKKSE